MLFSFTYIFSVYILLSFIHYFLIFYFLHVKKQSYLVVERNGVGVVAGDWGLNHTGSPLQKYSFSETEII
jgi:hypothetical protein